MGFLRVSEGKVLYFTENTPSHGQSKIALQGAGNRPGGTLGITLFSLGSMVSRVCQCMPPGASILNSSRQEQCFPG